MAVFGRRQPHAPIVLRGLRASEQRPPVARLVLAGQKTAQLAADRYFRRSFTPVVIKRLGPRPSVARSLVVGQKTAQLAADRYFRRALTPVIVKRAGGRPTTARLLIVGQRANQGAADRFWRRSFPPIVKRAGGARPVGKALLAGQKTAQLAAFRPVRRPVFVSKAPPTSTGIFLRDTFTDSNGTNLTSHVMDVGPGWIARVGTWYIQSNTAQPNSDADGDQVTAESGQSDYTLDIDLTPQSEQRPCLMFRWSGVNDFLMVDPRLSENRVAVYKRVGGTFFQIGTSNQTLAAGSTYTLQVVTSGNSITVYWQGSVILTLTESFNNTATAIGLYLDNQSGTTRPSWDNLNVAVTAAPAAPVGRLLLFGQKTGQTAADRAYRRSFSPIVKRAGGAKPANRFFVAGTKTSQAAADRYFRRSFPPLVKRAGGATPGARLLAIQRLAQLASRRPGGRPYFFVVPPPQPVPPPPVPPPPPFVPPPPAPPPVVRFFSVDEETAEAVRGLWLSAAFDAAAVAVDEDTAEAIRKLWQAGETQP